MRGSTAELAGRARSGEAVALGRLITQLVRDPAILDEVVTGRVGGVGALGITGPPGAGKSSLISAIDELWQAVDAHREFCAAHRDTDAHPAAGMEVARLLALQEGPAASEDRAVALAVREVIGTASDPDVRADLNARGDDEERARRLLQLALQRAHQAVPGTTT